MTYQLPPDLEALVQQRMETGNYATPEQVLRSALEQLASLEVEVYAIQESIDLLEAGDEGMLLDDAFASLRAKHNIPADA